MFRKVLLFFFLSLISLGALFFYQKALFSDGKLQVTFCDVGQGDGIFIRTPQGSDILIDGGPDDAILSCLSDNMPFWDRTIDLMVLTHPHADHLNGLISVAKRYTVRSFATGKPDNQSEGYVALQQALQKKKVAQRLLCQNDRFRLPEGITLQTLWPKCNPIGESNDDVNLDSVVQLLSYGKVNLLFTGDINAATANQVTTMAGRPDVLKIPHHGSQTGIDETFLSSITPQLAIISVGKDNSYGHPAQLILSLLTTNGIKTARTDKNGTISLTTDGKTITMRRK